MKKENCRGAEVCPVGEKARERKAYNRDTKLREAQRAEKADELEPAP
jgi:hypothetical protein